MLHLWPCLLLPRHLEPVSSNTQAHKQSHNWKSPNKLLSHSLCTLCGIPDCIWLLLPAHAVTAFAWAGVCGGTKCKIKPSIVTTLKKKTDRPEKRDEVECNYILAFFFPHPFHSDIFIMAVSDSWVRCWRLPIINLSHVNTPCIRWGF